MEKRRAMNWLLKRLPTNPTTITGRMLGIATVTAVLAVVDSSLIPLLSQLIWVVIVAFVCGLLFRPKLAFQLRESSLLINGQESELEIVVVNVGSYPVYDVQLSFPYDDHGLLIAKQPKVIGVLAARAETVVSFQVRATARGEHSLPKVLVASLFPFGMFKFTSKRRIEAQVVVAPSYSYDSYEQTISQSGDASFGEQSSRRQRALEYIGSREYREGMAVRRWDFAAWARLGIPSIREFNEAQESAALIVVDSLKSRGRMDIDLEKLLSKTATATVALDRNGYRLVLVIVGANIEIVDGYGNRDQVETLLRCLAKVAGAQNQPDWSEVWGTVDETIERDWDVVCFLRSDHSVNTPSPPDEAHILNATIDWTPKLSVDRAAESAGHLAVLRNG